MTSVNKWTQFFGRRLNGTKIPVASRSASVILITNTEYVFHGSKHWKHSYLGTRSFLWSCSVNVMDNKHYFNHDKGSKSCPYKFPLCKSAWHIVGSQWSEEKSTQGAPSFLIVKTETRWFYRSLCMEKVSSQGSRLCFSIGVSRYCFKQPFCCSLRWQCAVSSMGSVEMWLCILLLQ